MAGNLVPDDFLTQTEMKQRQLVPFAIPFSAMRVHDAMATLLPAAAAADDMGLITGTPGTDAPTLQGIDMGGASATERCAFTFTIPSEYDAAESITVRVRAQMVTTISDGDVTIDCECWKPDNAGAVGSDLCTTAAISMNSLTAANKDFTITPTGISAGDELIIRLTFGGSDTGNLGVMIPEIVRVAVLLDIRG